MSGKKGFEEQMKKSVILPIALLAVLAISVSVIGLGLGETDPNLSGQTVRHISIDEGSQAILVRSDLKQGNTENHFGLWFNDAHGVVIRVAFNQNQEESASENTTHFNMYVAYINLIEYNDTNHNGAFDLGVDGIVQRVPLWNWTYSVPTRTDISSTDGKQGYRLEAHTINAPFTFTVMADIFPEYVRVGSTVLQPTETKITTEIDGFHFKQAASRISLQVVAVSQTNVETENSQLEQNIRVRSSTANGYFKIDPSATVDGNAAQAVTSVNTFRAPAISCPLLKDPMNREECLERGTKGTGPIAVISISFPQGSKIVHDPILGIEITGPTPILTMTLIAGTAIAAIAVFGLLVYAGRRSLARPLQPTASPL